MKKFLAIFFVILVAAFIIFNYIAANQAEKQIDEAIQIQADSSAFSAQYSSIDVSPFRGNIDFSDLTIVRGDNIERAGHMHLDLRYIDFLHIYLGGVKYGLENLTAGNVQLKKMSYVNRGTMQQTSVGTATVKYNGNMWDGIRHLFMSKPLAFSHQLDITASQFGYSNPDYSVGSFKSDSAFVHFNWPKEQSGLEQGGDSLKFLQTTWSPPQSFQDKYAFFIQGFGFKQDSIPIATMGFSSTNLYQKRIKVSSGQLKTNLFTIRFDGTVLRDSALTDAQLAPLNVSLVDLSPKFENVLNNIEQLLGESLPKEQGKISFQLIGPLSNPQIVRD